MQRLSKKQIKKLCDDLESELAIKVLVPDQQRGTLYHYTDSAGFHGILKTREIWATHCAHLNDYKEFQLGGPCIQEVAGDLERCRDDELRALFRTFSDMHTRLSLQQVIDNIFVASFTERGNLLSQWRAYGDNGAGYSIGFTRLPVPEGHAEGGMAGVMLAECLYETNVFKETVKSRFRLAGDTFKHYVRRGDGSDDCFVALCRTACLSMFLCAGRLVPSLKHPGFEEEKEWRLVILPGPKHQEAIEYRDTARGRTPYVRIPLALPGEPIALDAVYVGPAQADQCKRTSAISLLVSQGYVNEGLVLDSGIPYRA